MLFQVIEENGQKKIIPLTADAGAGNPVGTIIPMYKKSSPSGYLYCDGSTFDQTAYPLLYAYLGSNVLPDYREFALVGAEENTTDVYNASTNPNGTIHDHDVYSEGQAKDDQLQDHTHKYTITADSWSGIQGSSTRNLYTQAVGITQGVNGARAGTVTRGKRKAVYFYIKATSGLSENAQDNVVAQLNEERSYSTEEINTGKKWIDGKPIYKKTLTGNVTANVTSEIDIATLNIADLPNVEGAVKTGENIIPFRYGTSSADVVMCFYNSTTGKFLVQSAYAGSFYVTIEYTKTTD